MRRALFSILFATALLVLTGCWMDSQPPPPTQLEIREFQTRKFDTTDTKAVVKALLDVLQDDGFIVRSVAMDVGFLNATKETDIGPSYAPFGGDPNFRYNKCAIIEVTANISAFGSQSKVRVNFQKKVLDNQGAVSRVYLINDPAYYQTFFEKVSKGLFLAQESL